MQAKVMAANLSACNLFFVWLLYENRFFFLLAQLSSAMTWKLLAGNFNTQSLDTVDNAEKNSKVVRAIQVFVENVT